MIKSPIDVNIVFLSGALDPLDVLHQVIDLPYSSFGLGLLIQQSTDNCLNSWVVLNRRCLSQQYRTRYTQCYICHQRS